MPNSSSSEANATNSEVNAQNELAILEHVRQAFHGLQYGEIKIIVRNGVVVQIDRAARKRQFKAKPIQPQTSPDSHADSD